MARASKGTMKVADAAGKLRPSGENATDRLEIPLITKASTWLTVIATVVAPVGLGATTPIETGRVLEIPPSATLTGTIARSAVKTSDRGSFALPVRIFSSPSSPGRPAIQQRIVANANLHQIPFAAHVRYNSVMGPRTERVRLARAKFGIEGVEFTRTVWTKEPSCGSICRSADVAMGPVAFAQPIVRYLLDRSVGGERLTALPLFIDARDNASSHIGFRGRQVEVLFAPDAEITVANASFARLVEAVGTEGPIQVTHVSGQATEENARTVVATWSAAFPLGSLDIKRAAVVDWAAIQSDDRTGDVVVKGRREDPPPPILVVGRDVLSRCSSIEFDKERLRITLSCH